MKNIVVVFVVLSWAYAGALVFKMLNPNLWICSPGDEECEANTKVYKKCWESSGIDDEMADKFVELGSPMNLTKHAITYFTCVSKHDGWMNDNCSITNDAQTLLLNGIIERCKNIAAMVKEGKLTSEIYDHSCGQQILAMENDIVVTCLGKASKQYRSLAKPDGFQQTEKSGNYEKRIEDICRSVIFTLSECQLKKIKLYLKSQEMNMSESTTLNTPLLLANEVLN